MHGKVYFSPNWNIKKKILLKYDFWELLGQVWLCFKLDDSLCNTIKLVLAVLTLCIGPQGTLWEWHRGWRAAQHNAPACYSSHQPWRDCRSPERHPLYPGSRPGHREHDRDTTVSSLHSLMLQCLSTGGNPNSTKANVSLFSLQVYIHVLYYAQL